MSASRRSEPNGHLGRDMASLCAKLLAADKRARQAGTPFLTRDELRYLKGVLAAAKGGGAATAGRAPAGNARSNRRRRPRWDAPSRQLWLGRRLLKEFRQPAQNQTALLDAFQATGWATRHLSNPLPPTAGETEDEAQERLHETIKSVNRAMPPGTIHFRGDGTGHGVWWEYV